MKHALLIERWPSSDWLTPKAKSETFFMFVNSLLSFPLFPKSVGEIVMINPFLAIKRVSLAIVDQLLHAFAIFPPGLTKWNNNTFKTTYCFMVVSSSSNGKKSMLWVHGVKMYEPGKKRSYGDERTENQQMHFNIHGRRSLRKSDLLLETSSV